MFGLILFQNHSILQMKMIEELTLGNKEVIIGVISVNLDAQELCSEVGPGYCSLTLEDDTD